MLIQHDEPYAPLRAKAYQPVAEQLDAVYKLAEALLAAGVMLPAETVAWVEHCREVKSTYPKNNPPK